MMDTTDVGPAPNPVLLQRIGEVPTQQTQNEIAIADNGDGNGGGGGGRGGALHIAKELQTEKESEFMSPATTNTGNNELAGPSNRDLGPPVYTDVFVERKDRKYCIYLVDSVGNKHLAVVGTDRSGTSHFVYEKVKGFPEGRNLKCKNMSTVWKFCEEVMLMSGCKEIPANVKLRRKTTRATTKLHGRKALFSPRKLLSNWNSSELNQGMMKMERRYITPLPVGKVRKGRFTDHIEGRDEIIFQRRTSLYASEAAGNERHVCTFDSINDFETFSAECSTYLNVFLRLYADGKLPENRDGRQSAGPLDVSLIELPASGEKLHSNSGIDKVLQFGVHFHIHPDGRKCFLGDLANAENKKTAQYMKSWKSFPIPSWSGGHKLFRTGHEKNLVRNQLSKIPALKEVEVNLIAAARILWQQFKLTHGEAAAFQERYKQEHIGAQEPLTQGDVQSSSSLCGGDLLTGTGWNAYTLNVNFRTACHHDSKNVKGSYSALVVFTYGEEFKGGFYMMPEFNLGFDLRNGSTVLFHTSDRDLHGNSALHLPSDSSLRVSLVFYLTKLSSTHQPEIAKERLETGREERNAEIPYQNEEPLKGLYVLKGTPLKEYQNEEPLKGRYVLKGTPLKEYQNEEPLKGRCVLKGTPLKEYVLEGRPLEVNQDVPCPREEEDIEVCSSSLSDDEYRVEQILDYRLNSENLRIEYLIKWEGYSSEHNSWEPKENCNCPDKEDRYWSGVMNNKLTQDKVKKQ